jgi:hypothetical protein
MTRSLIPPCVAAAIALALLQTGPEPVKPGIPPAGLQPGDANALRIPRVAGSEPMLPLMSRAVMVPAAMPDHVPGLEDESAIRKGLSQGDSVTMPLVYPSPLLKNVKDEKDKKKLSELELPDEKENPFAALVPKGMDPDSGWGWLADDLQNVQKAAARSAREDEHHDNMGLSMPGSGPDADLDDVGLSRGRRLQLE